MAVTTCSVSFSGACARSACANAGRLRGGWRAGLKRAASIFRSSVHGSAVAGQPTMIVYRSLWQECATVVAPVRRLLPRRRGHRCNVSGLSHPLRRKIGKPDGRRDKAFLYRDLPTQLRRTGTVAPAAVDHTCSVDVPSSRKRFLDGFSARSISTVFAVRSIGADAPRVDVQWKRVGDDRSPGNAIGSILRFQ